MQSKNDARVVDEDVKMSRLHVIAVDQPGVGKVLTRAAYSVNGDRRRSGYDWSPDSKTMVFSHTRTPSPDDWPTAGLSLVEVATGTVKPLVDTKAAEFSPHYSPDGKWIAYVASNQPPTWAGDATIRIIAADGRLGASWPKPSTASAATRNWSAGRPTASVYFSGDAGTVHRLNALPLDGPPREISKADGVFADGVALNATRTAFGFAWANLTAPGGGRVSPVERFDAQAVSRINAELAKSPLPTTEVIRWKSPDGQEVEGLLTYPIGYEKGKRYPLLLVIHGGPAGVFTQSYIAAPGLYPIATFAARGYLVLRPNPRGSSGYGSKFRHANYNDWGGGDFKDLMAGVDHVIASGMRRRRPPGRDGLELRRLHDLMDDHADQTIQGRLGRCRRHQPLQLHRHRRHSELPPRLFRRRAVGPSSTPTEPFRHVPGEGRDYAHADPARRARRARAVRKARSSTTPSNARAAPRKWSSIRERHTASKSRSSWLIACTATCAWFDKHVRGK